MLKSILLLIKAHAVATTITATVLVVGTTSVVVIPQVVENYKLNQSVKANLYKLVSSDFQTTDEIYNQTTNEVSEEITTTREVDTTKPLTFMIKRIETNYDDGGKLVEFVIVPSYDKDFSQWSKEEKEDYDKAIKESAKMTEEEGQKMQQEEEQNLANAEQEVQKIINSWSKEYECGIGRISYNSYTKKYKGDYLESTTTIQDDSFSSHTNFNYKQIDNVSAQEFRNNIYPIMLQKFQERNNEGALMDAKQYKANLEEVYHLSD